jgi:hypothetical protein
MNKSLPIPKEEQLGALASGLKDVYRLLGEYLGDLNKVPNSRRHITVTKDQLADYLRCRPELANQHVSQPSDLKRSETPILEYADGKYRVYVFYQGRILDEKYFSDLTDAAAEYLMWCASCI